ncbi:hypothetical protein JOD31_001170 [Methylopila capsulata]|uniref:General secretion pathway protein N n=1 Tax=Methylopila capsulata TaxID=61654 RepID=A0A9W6IP93_9HYPH|nr:hypothetical protein [Methylopila capsulata]MBM7850945.1 hypothetical protein [Methylopila capsulata]GLK54003.1 hypothetical protein GCM10008170_00220 [Methylopila capsulata]
MTPILRAALTALLAAALPVLPIGAAAQETAEDKPAPPAAEAALNPLNALGADSLSAFRDRPLFTPSRRAPQPPAAVQAEPEPEPETATAPPPAPQPNLRLAGVIEGPDETVAVVEDMGSNTVSQLRLGDMLDGWLVTAIDSASLRLTLGEQEGEYRLFDPNQAARPKQHSDE